MKRRCVLFFVLAIAVNGFAATWDWKTFTNSRNIKHLAASDTMVWAATDGGVLEFDTGTRTFKKYTNTEGLFQINIATVAYDTSGYLWAGMDNGLLQILNTETGLWQTYNEFQNRLSVHAILPYQDFVLVASDLGLAELRLDSRQRWERTWKADIGPISSIAIAHDYIYVGQEDGLRRIPLDFPNKQVPNEWEHFTRFDGLPANDVQTLSTLNSELFIGTLEGFCEFDGASFSAPTLTNHQIGGIVWWQNRIAFVSNHGVFTTNETGSWIELEAEANLSTLVTTGRGELIAGSNGSGMYSLADSAWTHHSPNCPGSNGFVDLLVDDRGYLWTANNRDGVSRFDGNTWTVYKLYTDEENPRLGDARAIEQDQFGRIWVGTWGQGVFLFNEVETDSFEITHLGGMDGNLSGADSPNYVVVNDLFLDSENQMWFSNYAAGNSDVIAAYDLLDGWQHWSTSDGILSNQTIHIEEDDSHRIWVATTEGVSVIDYNETLLDKSDDSLEGTLRTPDGLESNNVRALAWDLDRQMWVGTDAGLHYWLGGVVRFEPRVINDNITALYLDALNNRWIGTAGGLTLYSDDGRRRSWATTDSKIVSDNITCFALNDQTGDLYVGTINGLSQLETPYTRPAASLSTVKGYPNPFVIDSPASRFYIDNLTRNAAIKIFTPDGFLIKTISTDEVFGARISWDGTNNDGDLVAPGVYVYLITADGGQNFVGKIAVVR